MKLLTLIPLIILISCGKNDSADMTPCNNQDSNNDLVLDIERDITGHTKGTFLEVFSMETFGNFSMSLKNEKEKHLIQIPLGKNTKLYKNVLLQNLVKERLDENEKSVSMIEFFLRKPYLKVLGCIDKGALIELQEKKIKKLDEFVSSIKLETHLSYLLPESKLNTFSYELLLINPENLMSLKLQSSTHLSLAGVDQYVPVKELPSMELFANRFCLIMNIKNFNLRVHGRVINYDEKEKRLNNNSMDNASFYQKENISFPFEKIEKTTLYRSEKDIISFKNQEYKVNFHFNELFDKLSYKVKSSFSNESLKNQSKLKAGQKIKIAGFLYKKAITPKAKKDKVRVACQKFELDFKMAEDVSINGCYCERTIRYSGENLDFSKVQNNEVITLNEIPASFHHKSYREFEVYNSYFKPEMNLSEFKIISNEKLEVIKTTTYKMVRGLAKCPKNSEEKVSFPVEYKLEGSFTLSTLL